MSYLSKKAKVKCPEIIFIDGKGSKCGRDTFLVGGFFWCKFCEEYVKDPRTKKLITEEY